MKLMVLNGTPVKGVTWHMKELFLQAMGTGHQVTEFYPQDMPPFCLGCKGCFLHGEATCPHAAQTAPIWAALLEADLLVFAYPVYALRAPASIKSLLDHLCVHWMVHRPDPALFSKTAVILTNSVGAPNSAAQKDVKTSLNWMGVSRVLTCGMGMMGDIFWDTMTPAHRKALEEKTARLAKRASALVPRRGMAPKVRLFFAMSKRLHQAVLDGEADPSLDNRHYLEHGWITRKNKSNL